MSGRRGHHEGSIRQRTTDGRWEVRIDLGRGPNGKRRRKSAFAPTQAAAITLLKQLNGRQVSGGLTTTSTPTVATHLEQWFATNTDRWRPSTRRSYRAAIDHYLVPAFGSLRLEQLSPAKVQTWLTEQKNLHGARRRVTLAHAALRAALSEAQRLQLVPINAAALVRVPQPTTRRIAPLDLAQSRAFLVAVGAHRLAALFSVALCGGLRLGEVCGLRWEDVDLATGAVQVRQQLQKVGKRLVVQPLKTARSRRTLVLPQVCLDALTVHRTRQREERLKAGAQWIDSGGLVFTTFRCSAGRHVGTPLHPRNVLRTLHALLVAAKLPRVRFHDLRHSAASLLIAEGVQLAEVSMLLGHSELRVTADLYSHLQQETAAKAATQMDRLFGALGGQVGGQTDRT
jgi:integrase